MSVGGKKKKKWNAQKDRILKCVKCQWEEMIHIELIGKNIES